MKKLIKYYQVFLPYKAYKYWTLLKAILRMVARFNGKLYKELKATEQSYEQAVYEFITDFGIKNKQSFTVPIETGDEIIIPEYTSAIKPKWKLRGEGTIELAIAKNLPFRKEEHHGIENLYHTEN